MPLLPSARAIAHGGVQPWRLQLNADRAALRCRRLVLFGSVSPDRLGRARTPRPLSADSPPRLGSPGGSSHRATTSYINHRAAPGCLTERDPGRSPAHQSRHNGGLRPVPPFLLPRPDLRAHDRHGSLIPTAARRSSECRGYREVVVSSGSSRYQRDAEPLDSPRCAPSDGDAKPPESAS